MSNKLELESNKSDVNLAYQVIQIEMKYILLRAFNFFLKFSPTFFRMKLLKRTNRFHVSEFLEFFNYHTSLYYIIDFSYEILPYILLT